jgi:hypothetical protein
MSREKNLTSTTPRKRAPRKTPAKKSEIVQATPTFTHLGPEQRAALIAEAAYFRAERRGFAPGHEAEDWLAAEAEVDSNLLRGDSAPRV